MASKQTNLEPNFTFQTEPLLTFDADFEKFFGNVEIAANTEQHAHILKENLVKPDHNVIHDQVEVNVDDVQSNSHANECEVRTHSLKKENQVRTMMLMLTGSYVLMMEIMMIQSKGEWCE